MQTLPNLIGQVVTLQAVATGVGAANVVGVCVSQSDSFVVVVNVDGGVLSRLQTFLLHAWEVTAYYDNLLTLSTLLDNLEATLQSDRFTLTDIGRTTITEACRAVGRVLSASLRKARQEKREAEDAYLAANRTAEDLVHDSVFAQFEPEQFEIGGGAGNEPFNGATFSEQPYAGQGTPQDVDAPQRSLETIGTSAIPAGEQVKLYIVVEHENPEIVARITSKIRSTIRESLE